MFIPGVGFRFHGNQKQKEVLSDQRASQVALVVKNPPANEADARDTRDTGSIPGWEVPLEKVMATTSGILAWRIPWT